MLLPPRRGVAPAARLPPFSPPPAAAASGRARWRQTIPSSAWIGGRTPFSAAVPAARQSCGCGAAAKWAGRRPSYPATTLLVRVAANLPASRPLLFPPSQVQGGDKSRHCFPKPSSASGRCIRTQVNVGVVASRSRTHSIGHRPARPPLAAPPLSCAWSSPCRFRRTAGYEQRGTSGARGGRQPHHRAPLRRRRRHNAQLPLPRRSEGPSRAWLLSSVSKYGCLSASVAWMRFAGSYWSILCRRAVGRGGRGGGNPVSVAPPRAGPGERGRAAGRLAGAGSSQGARRHEVDPVGVELRDDPGEVLGLPLRELVPAAIGDWRRAGRAR